MKLQTIAREYATGNVALTTSLVTSGFPWQDESRPLQNIYDTGKPERLQNGRLRKLGAVTYYLSNKSTSFPQLTLGAALDAYDGKTSPGRDLDELLEGDGTVEKSAVRALLGPSFVECSRKTLANLKEVKAMPHVCIAHIRRKKPDGYPVVISENFDREKALEWGIDMGGDA